MIRINRGLVVKITYVLNPPGELQNLEFVGYFMGTDAEEISRELCEFFREYRSRNQREGHRLRGPREFPLVS